MPRFEKGSQEAKDYMASIRAKKGGTPNPNKKPTKTQVKMNMGVDIPIVGSNTLIFPEYLAQPTKNGYKLVNPLTQQRHLATRAGKTAVKLVRKPVPDLILLEGQNEPIPLKMFSKKDRTIIDTHFDNIEKNKNTNPELIPEIPKTGIVKSRGRPEKLPKNIEFNKQKKKENIKMVITAKKAGRKPKYSTDEERKVAKRKQTLASNKKKRAEAKGKGMKGGNLRDDVMHILTYIVNEYFPNDPVVHKYLNSLGEDGELALVMNYIRNDAEDIRGVVDDMMEGNFDKQLQDEIADLVAFLTNISADEGAGTDTDTRSVGSVEGTGIFGDISNALKNTFTSAVKKTKEYANVIISGRNDYPPKVRKILSELGTKMIKSAMVRRTPVPSVLTTALNAVSLGEFAKRFKNAPYDTLFHLSLVLDLEGGTKLLIEKNEVINMDKNPSIPPKTDIQLVSNIPANLSVNDMLQKAQQRMGGYYFTYSARDNNCQDYIMAILQANNMGNDENYTFIKQDTKQLFEGLTTLRKVSNTITDIGAKINEITTGAGARTRTKKMKGGMVEAGYETPPPVIPLTQPEGNSILNAFSGATPQIRLTQLQNAIDNIQGSDIRGRFRTFVSGFSNAQQTNMYMRIYDAILAFEYDGATDYETDTTGAGIDNNDPAIKTYKVLNSPNLKIHFDNPDARNQVVRYLISLNQIDRGSDNAVIRNVIRNEWANLRQFSTNPTIYPDVAPYTFIESRKIARGDDISTIRQEKEGGLTTKMRKEKELQEEYKTKSKPKAKRGRPPTQKNKLDDLDMEEIMRRFYPEDEGVPELTKKKKDDFGDDEDMNLFEEGLFGNGLKNTIDFEDMKWGSLTKQVEVYNQQHKTKLDLHSFSMMVLANPDKFKERTKKRARFYINVINKKAMKNNISNNNITIMPKKAMKGGNVNKTQIKNIFEAHSWFRTLNKANQAKIIQEAVFLINDEFGGVLTDESVMDMGGIEGFVESFRDYFTNVPIIRPMTKVSLMNKFQGKSVASDIVDTGKDIYNRARKTLGVGLYASGSSGNGLYASSNMSGGAIITQNGVMYPTHTIIHYYGDPMRGIKGGDIWSDIGNALNPDKNGVAQAFQEKIVKPIEQTIVKPAEKAIQQTIVKPAEQTFTPELGRKITTGLIRQALPAVIKGVVSSGTTAVTGNPVLGFVAGQTAGKVAGDKAGEELAKATGYGVARKGRFVKGSKEAKDYMASLRAKKNA